MSFKFAVLNSVSLRLENSFESLTRDKIRKQIESNINFIDFTNTKDLFSKLHENLGKGVLEVMNCDYDKNYLTQGLYFENDIDMYKKLALVKRKIKQNDSYTFLDFDPKNPDDEKYEYISINIEDIVELFRNKYVHAGIIVTYDGIFKQIEYIDLDDSDKQKGKIIYKLNDSDIEINYLNFVNVIQELHEKQTSISNIDKYLHEKIEELNIDHMYSKKDFAIGVFSCYIQTKSLYQNEIISKLFKDCIFGNVIIGLETKHHNDVRSLKLTPELFKQILNFINVNDGNKKYKPKNIDFFNIFNELD